MKTKWNVDFLESKRKEADPLADELIAKIIKDHQQSKFHELWQHLVSNSGIKFDQLTPEVRNYFEQSSILPDFADEQLIEKGQHVFGQHGLIISLILLCKSMPQSYACKTGAMVLHQTGRLTAKDNDKLFQRRLMETSQFVINVMSPGGLNPENQGMITAQKIRLIHASIRYYLKDKGWDTKNLGEPINQEDLAGTLLSFSALVIEGLEKMQIELTDDEKEAYIHSWNVIGHIMGVQDEMIPKNYTEAVELGYAIFDHQIEGSKEGRELTDACVLFLQQKLPFYLRGVPRSMIHYLIGTEASEAVGLHVKHNCTDKLTAKFLRYAFKHTDSDQPHHPGLIKVSEYIKVHLIKGLIKHFNHHKNINFYIPPSLSERWKV